MLLSLGNMTNVIKNSVQNKKDTLYNKTQVENLRQLPQKKYQTSVHYNVN